MSKGNGISANFCGFDPEVESIENFLERLESYFQVYEIASSLDKVHNLSLLLAPNQYNILKNKIAPKKVIECSYEDCCKHLISYYAPQTRVIAETFKFHSRKQAVDEPILNYISDLKQLAIKCNFGEYLDRALRDQLVSGIRDKDMINKLLMEDDNLTFDRASQIVTDMESAGVSSSATVTSTQTTYI